MPASSSTPWPRASKSPNAAPAGSFPPSVYTDLHHALADGDAADVRSEIMNLIGLNADGKVVARTFTGSKESDSSMPDHLTPDELKLYLRAQKEHAADAQFFQQVLAGMRRDPDTKKALDIASLSNRHGNKGRDSHVRKQRPLRSSAGMMRACQPTIF